MKTKQEIISLHIVSEPGDATRYDYIVISEGDTFYFFPYGSTSKFPKYISRYETNVDRIAKKFDCNPWTVKECLRTIQEQI